MELQNWENADWARAKNTSTGETGTIPANFLSAEIGRSVNMR